MKKKSRPFSTTSALFSALLTAAAFADSPARTDELFGFKKVGSAHLAFTPEQWKAIKPGETPMPGFGGPPPDFLSGPFLRQLDADKNGRLSREEFTTAFDRWFLSWDTKKAGFLDADAVRDGLTKELNAVADGPGGTPPAFGLQASKGKRNGLSGMRGIEFDFVHADLEYADRKFSDVAVRYKGNGTYMDARNTDKKSLKIDLNEFVKGQKLLGLSKLNFHNNVADAAWMNESLAYALYRDAGVPAPRTAYTRLDVSVPGLFDRKFFGLYTSVENLDTNWAEDRFGSKKGLILKPVTRELFILKSADWLDYEQAYDPKTDITEAQVRRFFAFAKLVTSASDEEFAAQLPEFLDVDEFSRFMAVTVWISSTDSILMMGQNFVTYLHPKTQKFLFVPWDLDRAFSNFFVPTPEELSIRNAWGEDNRFLQRAMKVPAVRDAYLARLEEFQTTLFQPAKLNQRIDEIAALIRPAVAAEGAEKLARFEKSITEEDTAVPPEPGVFRMPSTKPIKAFIAARHRSVAEQLAGKSEGRALTGGGFGRPPGGGGNRPGGPGGGGFGLGTFLGPILMKAADADANSQIAAPEFQALAARWFGEWDADSDGLLDAEQLRAGLVKAFPMPNFGRPPAPAPAP